MSVTVLADLDLDRRRDRVQRRRAANGSHVIHLGEAEREVDDLAHQRRLRGFAWRVGFIAHARAAALDAGDKDQAAVWLRELLDLQAEWAAYSAA